MRISVVICTWNRCASLAQALDSLAKVVVPSGCEVETLVLDNNSTDQTHTVVSEREAAWPLGSLRYLFEGRQGKQFALNTGIAQSTGQLLAFTDDDIAFPANWLDLAVELFSDSAIELAGGRTLIEWQLEGPPSWYQNDMLAILAGVDLGPQRLDPVPPHYAPGGSNMFVRRSLFERVGGFDEKLYRHMDHEFGLRCLSQGARVVYEPRLTVYAPVDPAVLTQRYFRRWSFKAGFARSGGADAVKSRWPEVPLWMYRQMLEDWFAIRSPWPRQSEAERFGRELRLWRVWGTVANAWHAFLKPADHAAWVKRHSQKQANLY